MSDYLSAIVLGIVEGLTEMLPVSSTGHLILLNQWFAFSPGFTELFDVVIQSGAILAVLWYFHRDVFNKEAFTGGKIPHLWIATAIATVPILMLGYLFSEFITSHLFRPQTVATSLLLGGIVLTFIEKINLKRIEPIESNGDYRKLSFRNAFLIGLFQCLALIPGTSRSAAAIVGGMLLGIEKTVAAKFSFVIAIPAILLASVYALLGVDLSLWEGKWGILLVGFTLSYIFCWLSIAWFFKFLGTFGLAPFGWYRIILSLVVFLLFL